MIADKPEYEHASKQLAEQKTRLTRHREKLREDGLDNEQIKRAMDPLESFYFGKLEEVQAFAHEHDAR